MTAFRIRLPDQEPQPFGKRTRAVKSKDYLSWLHELPCILTKSRPVEAAHLSTAKPEFGHFGRGKGQKASDRWALPLSPALHAEQHNGNEMEFWAAHGVNPHFAAVILFGLFSERGDDAIDHATRLIEQDFARTLYQERIG